VTLTKLALIFVIVSIMLVSTPSHIPPSSDNPSRISRSPTPTAATTLASTDPDFGDLLVETTTALFPVTNVPDFQITAKSPATVNAGTNASTTITVTGLNGFFGFVTLSDTVPSGLTCGAINPVEVTGSGNATVYCNAAVGGPYTLTVTGTSGSLSHSTTATFNFVDFRIAAPSPAAIDTGQSATTTATINPLNGFEGVVTLTDTVPSGLTCGAITPGTVTGSGIPTVSCSATVAGTYSLTVKGTSGSLVHTATATLNFVDFTITASSPAIASAGESVASTITITAANGFTGVVTLTDTTSAGLTCGAITPGIIPGYGITSVSCSASAGGTYVLTIAGTNGPLVHSATATFTYAAPDFTLSTSVRSLNINKGGPRTATVSIKAKYGFASIVTLSIAAPTGITCNLNPASIGSSNTSTLTCNGNTDGDYTVTITGTAGATIHSSTLTVHVATVSPAAPAPTTILGLAPAIFDSIIGIIIVAIIAGLTLLVRKSKRVKT
jgi:roadblock/LC7 domain-containing protein